MLALAIKRYLRRTSQLGFATILASSFVFIATAIDVNSHNIQEATVAHALENSSFAESGISVTYDGVFSIVSQERLAQEVQKVQSHLTVEPFTQFVTYRPIVNSTGQTFHVVGIDSSHTKLLSGNAPSVCTENKCEVALLSGSDIALPSGLVSTGTIGIDTTAVSDLTLQSGIPVYVTNDVQGLLAHSSIKDMPRTLVWATRATPATFIKHGSEQTLIDMRNQANDMSLLSGRLVLHFPDVLVQQAVDQSKAAINRLQRLELVIAMLLLIGIASIAENARISHSAAMRVLEQIQGRSPRAMPVVSAIVAHIPVLALGALVAGMSNASFGILIAFLAASFVVTTTVLQFGLRPIQIVFAIAVAGTIVWLREPALVAVVVTVAVLLVARLVIRRRWKEPIALATSRSAPLLVSSVLLAVSAAVVSGWAVTSNALDKQELHHIDYVAPLSSTISGLESGVLQNVSLDDYRALGNAVALEKISATTSGKALTVQNIQIVGVPNDLKLPNQSKIGGPSPAQMESLRGDVAQDSLNGIGKPIDVKSLPAHVQLGVWVLDKNNKSVRLPISTVLSSTDRVIGVEAYESAKDIERREHAVGEGAHAVDLPHGRLTFTFPNGSVVDSDIRLTSGSVFYSVTTGSSELHAIVNSDLAKVGDTLVVSITPNQSVKVSVVGVAERFATATHNFAIIDQAELNNYLATTSPALIRTTEIWLDKSVPLNDERFTGLKIVRRDELSRAFAIDPVRNGIRHLFFAIGIFVISALLLLTMTTITRELRNSNLPEWRGRGYPEANLKRNIVVPAGLTLLMSAMIGVFAGFLVTAKLVAVESTTWAGLAATPPIGAQMSANIFAVLVVVVGAAVVIGAVLGRLRHVD